MSENIKMIGILHFAGNLISGGLLGTLLIVGYLLVKNNLTDIERKTCYNIINFNISFWIYFGVSLLLMIILIGFVIFPIIFLCWVIFLIIGFIKHLAGETYDYPMSIKFLK